MKTAGTQHFIERTYREGGTFQWVRETWLNAVEAGATRIEFGIEWQAVEGLGVYRRTIADNGCGMSPEQLVEFFNTFGGGGKPIGGAHENFGVGAKTALLPWNRYGVVVVSWVDGEPSMIWLQNDPVTGEYGLRLEEVESDEGEVSLDEVYGPYGDDDHGCDWESVKPAWIQEHGTVIVLLGNDPLSDTVLGAPDHVETDIKGVSSYLNRRVFSIPDGSRVMVDELRTQERSLWPRRESEAHSPAPATGHDRRTNLRTIQGARHFIQYPEYKTGGLAASGTVDLIDGTKVDWYLWEGKRPAVQSYAAISGYIGTLYKNELYDVTSHHSTYRSFGVTESAVRQNLWLIINPPLLGVDGKHGIYPRTDRNGLLLKGGVDAGGPLPIADWGNEFADNIPEALLEAIKRARQGETGEIQDEAWRERLAERFGSRWRIWKLRAKKGGKEQLDPNQEGTSSTPRKRKRKKSGHSGTTGGMSGAVNTGGSHGPVEAARAKVGGGLPHYRLVGAGEMGEGMLAAWAPNDPIHSEGAVLVNVDHPVLREEVLFWQQQYPEHHAEEIANDVMAIYGEIAVAKIAHSEHLKGLIPSKTIEDDLRSEPALTMALLGLIAEEAVIAPRIGGKFRKRKVA